MQFSPYEVYPSRPILTLSSVSYVCVISWISFLYDFSCDAILQKCRILARVLWPVNLKSMVEFLDALFQFLLRIESPGRLNISVLILVLPVKNI